MCVAEKVEQTNSRHSSNKFSSTNLSRQQLICGYGKHISKRNQINKHSAPTFQSTNVIVQLSWPCGIAALCSTVVLTIVFIFCTGYVSTTAHIAWLVLHMRNKLFWTEFVNRDVAKYSQYGILYMFKYILNGYPSIEKSETFEVAIWYWMCPSTRDFLLHKNYLNWIRCT